MDILKKLGFGTMRLPVDENEDINYRPDFQRIIQFITQKQSRQEYPKVCVNLQTDVR